MKRRLIILVFASLSVAVVYSQEKMRVMSGLQNKRWRTSTFGNLTFTNGWFSGGGFTAFSAPLGLQLTHQLNKNLYAFGRLSVAPTFLNFNSAFNNPVFNKTASGQGIFNNNTFGVYPRAEAGLFYINDEKTFSISGSMFIDRGTNLYYPSYGIGNYPARSFR